MGDFRTELNEISEKYQGQTEKLLGKNMLTLANMLNSSRALMWSSQTDQITNLEHPETPRIFTGHENLVGKYSSAYYEAKGDKKVIAKINKFKGLNKDFVYIIVVYDMKKKMYDIIERVPGERKTETYGYKFNNDGIDKLNPGDIINKGDVLYKSTSFDENMNYGYGINATTLFITDHNVIEDPVVISRSFANKLKSIEYDEIKISVNDNDLFLNSYGDNYSYKCFPDIGEKVKDSVVAVKRRINYAESLYSLKNMNKPLLSDTMYYAPYAEEDTIVDIDIYCNKPIEDIPDYPFNQQLIKYINMSKAYHEEMVQVLGEIVESGEKYSDDLGEAYIRAKKILEPDRKWQDHNKRVFNNMVVSITVEKKIPVDVGSKLCGRFGDKGVISAILDDDQMPILETGQRVDMIASIIGVGARLNGGQLVEVELNFVADRVIDIIRATPDLSEKTRILYRFLQLACTNDYPDLVLNSINEMSLSEMSEFFEYIEDTYDLHIHQPPMDNITIEMISDIYKEFNIKPVKAYVERFGRMVPILRPVVAGKKYIVKLKHHPKTKTSVRSTGFINSKDLPTKSASSKENKALFSNTALKFGEMEMTNLLMNKNSEALNKFNMLYSSSIVGRRSISQIYEGDIYPEEVTFNEDATNRNAEIFRVYLKGLGVGLRFKDENEEYNK